MSLITLEKIRAGYGDRTVLRGIDLEVKEGEFVAIIGPNGAGKSTLARVLSRNLRPSGGAIALRGRPYSSYGTREFAREVAVVHQADENLLPFTVGEFARLGRFPHQRMLELESDEDRGALERGLELAGVAHLRERPLTELSGGERRLAHIARALVQGGSLLILDEPVTHLDIRHTVRVMDILHALHGTGKAVMAVLHDINIAADYCTRIIAIKDGAVFADGAPAEVVRYEAIESLFGTVCVVFENPITKKPYTFPAPGFLKKDT